MPGQRFLIVNADDFGLSSGVNRGIIESHEKGIVTSTSLMVRWPAAAEAAQYAQAHPRLSVGLHVDVAEWIYRDEQWIPKYQIVSMDDPNAVAEEVGRQLARFQSLMGRNPTHIDSHQHAHRSEPLLTILTSIANQLSVPLRSFSARIQYCGDFYGQTGEGTPYLEGISVENLLTVFQNLPTGVTELGCHPGQDDQLDSVYRLERKQEVAALCDPRVSTAMASLGIKLCSFGELPEVRYQSLPAPIT
jgi:chitin disaccharide deacetylase